MVSVLKSIQTITYLQRHTSIRLWSIRTTFSSKFRIDPSSSRREPQHQVQIDSVKRLYLVGTPAADFDARQCFLGDAQEDSTVPCEGYHTRSK
jgi:hypothetical protein